MNLKYIYICDLFVGLIIGCLIFVFVVLFVCVDGDRCIVEFVWLFYNVFFYVILLIKFVIGQIVFVNDVVEVYYGYDDDDLLKMWIQDINQFMFEQVVEECCLVE